MTGDTICKKWAFEPKEAPLAAWPNADQKFLVADEVKEFARFYIARHRTDLINTNIGYIFKQKASKSGESTILGQAKTESELQQTLHGLEALILIGFDTWLLLTLDEKMRLVAHELEHITWDSKTGKLKTDTHPVEEFVSILRIFGPGNDAQVEFLAAWETFKKDNGK
jgi:predicted metallopeptidase